MSDSSADAGQASGTAPTFTERELQMLGWAMQSLKSGPPDIDFDKLASFAGMSNPRSASNAWAKIRTKLCSSAGDATALQKTPRKKKAVPDDGADGNNTPKKTPRKRAAKKQDADGEASPKKKGRPAGKAKKSSNTVDTKDDEAEASDAMEEIEADIKTEEAATTASADDEI